eukprot:11179004-Ditylum_brightwellii.AAC.1
MKSQVWKKKGGDEQQSISPTYYIEQIWDEAASYLIGSLEGQYDKDDEISYMYSDDYDPQFGFGLYALANTRCNQFGTCSTYRNMPPSSPGRAKIVSVYRDLFYIGKNQITSLQCEELLETTIKQAQRWSLVPIIQSVIRYAIKVEELKGGSTLKVLAEGEMFALVILPLFHYQQSAANENDAARADLGMNETDQSIFERNMIVQQGVKPVQDGALEVARSLSTVVVDFSLPCEYIGETSGVSP